MAVTLDDLRVFIAVADAGSFGRAAAGLHTSQPAVSERMARLERDLARTLFTRGGRGVSLTRAGRRLLPYARRCAALAEEGIAAVRAEDAREPLRVAMHAGFAASMMPPIVDALVPLGIGIVATDVHTDHVITMLVDHTADLGVVVPWPHPPSISLEHCRDDPVACVAAPHHPLA